ncbi:hypothetical protein CBR_g32289 [Chara braunii]|uniref:Protein phosphatase n=1 Tax=Chara braunii TaxID=69332 RepID=A0A388JN95_CHABU|nr:hypothetical protein CBR_g32289 [Chara braunii]|eukprot:GBG59274.1 hypothetical protein CBR_g32289 [Chara braunii]
MPVFVRQDAMPSLASVLRVTTHVRARARQSVSAAVTCHSLRVLASHVSVANSTRQNTPGMASSSTAAASVARTAALSPPSSVVSPCCTKTTSPPPTSACLSITSSSARTRSTSLGPHRFTDGRHERGVAAPRLSASLSLSPSPARSAPSLLVCGDGGSKSCVSRLAEEWGRGAELCAGDRSSYSIAGRESGGSGEEEVVGCKAGGRRKGWRGILGVGWVYERATSKGMGFGGNRPARVVVCGSGIAGVGGGEGGRGGGWVCDHLAGGGHDRRARLLMTSAQSRSGHQAGGAGRGRREDAGGRAGGTPLGYFSRSYAFHFFNPSVSFPSDVYFRAIYESSISGEAGFEAGALQLDDEVQGEDLLEGADGDGEDEEQKEAAPTAVESSGIGSDRGLLRLYSGAVSLPHPDKVEKGGEDAHFISSDEHAVGVADGVGGWAEVGIDAGEYARQLMCNSVQALRQEPPGLADPVRVLARAHERTKVQGSSTACIILLRDDVLQAANLGDSGFILIRKGRTVFKSPPQQHSFNFPYQLGSGGSDSPESAEMYGIAVAPGDVIIVGTDGLFDNVYDTELATVVMHSINSGWGPQDTAQRISAIARLRAQDKHRQTPFARAAQEAGYRYQGGKMDDITVIVSYVTEKEKEKEKSGTTPQEEVGDTTSDSDSGGPGLSG